VSTFPSTEDIIISEKILCVREAKQHKMYHKQRTVYHKQHKMYQLESNEKNLEKGFQLKTGVHLTYCEEFVESYLRQQWRRL
jgi:hypothetical protein